MSQLVESTAAVHPPTPTRADATRVRFPFSLGEEVFYFGDAPGGLSNMEAEARFSGTLDEPRLRAALDAAVAVHPMLRARMARPRVLFRPPVWEVAESVDAGSTLEVVKLGDGDDVEAIRAEFCNRPIDLCKAPALRAMLVRRPGGDSLLVCNHHSTCDGVGVLRFLNSVARAYGGRPDPVPPDIDPVAARDKFQMLRQSSGKTPHPPRRRGEVAPLAFEGGTDSIGVGIRNLALPADLDPKRFGPGVTLNDLLIAAATLAVARWNADRGKPCDLIRVAVPANLRPAAWRSEVVANVVHLHLVSSASEDRSTPRALLAAISDQTRRLRDGEAFAGVFSAPPWLFWVLSQVIFPVLHRRLRDLPPEARPKASILLSNRGRVETKLPDFGPEAGEITEFWSTPPCTKQMGFSIGINILRGRLHLSLRHHLVHLDGRAAGAFFDVFREEFLALGRCEVGIGPEA